MVIFRTQFVSDYQMVWFSDAWSTRLVRFSNGPLAFTVLLIRVIKNILFMTKRPSLYHSKTGRIGPVFKWSKARQNSSRHFVFTNSKTKEMIRFSNCHLKTGPFKIGTNPSSFRTVFENQTI
jgi:hypothetical protein